MKRKIALLLVLAMVLSLVPANVFALQREGVPPQTFHPQGTGGPFSYRPTDNVPLNVIFAVQNFSSQHVASHDRRVAEGSLTSTPPALNLGIWLTDATFNNAWREGFDSGPDDNRIAPVGAVFDNNPATPAHRRLDVNFYDLNFDTLANALGWTNADFEGVGISVQVRSATHAHMVITHPTGPSLLPPNLLGHMSVTFPGSVNVRHENAWVHSRLGTNRDSGTILLSSPLASFGGHCVSVALIGDPGYFLDVTNPFDLRITENAVGTMSELANNADNRALAIRLVAPPNYFWATPGTGEMGVDFANAPPTAGTVWGANTYVSEGAGAITVPQPRLASPNGIITFGRMARYLYQGPGGRQELLLIVENVGRISGALADQIGQLDLTGLVLVAGPNAQTAPPNRLIDITVEVGSVSTLRACNVPANEHPTTYGLGGLWCHRGFSYFDWNKAAAPGLVNNNRANFGNVPDGIVVDSWQGRSNLWLVTEATGPTTDANWRLTDWPSPGNTNNVRNSIQPVPRGSNGFTHGQVLGGPRRSVEPCPWGQTQGGSGGTHGAGETVNHWGLDFERCPTSPMTIHVATRTIAGITLTTHGDEVELRSGAVGYNVSVPVAVGPVGQRRRVVTGITQQMRVNENVRGAMALSLAHPITFTLPEGVIVMGVRYNITGTGGPSDTVMRPLPGAAPNINVQFIGENEVRMAHQLPAITGTRRIEIYFYVSVEAGFEAANGIDEATIEVTVSGPGAALLPQDGDLNVIDVADVYDPVRVVHLGDAIEVDLVGREQNINHSEIGQVTITESRGNTLRAGDQIWVYVARRYGIGWPLQISRGTHFTDAESGLGLMVTYTRPFSVPGTDTIGILLTVTSESAADYPGTITLDGTTLFGHVYQGEVYYMVVTGPAIAENHSVVWPTAAVNRRLTDPTPLSTEMGTFTSLPYGIRVVEAVEFDDGTGREPGNRAPSLAGVTFSPSVMYEGAPQMIWYRAPGMHHEGGFVGARAFATLAGVSPEHINWVATTRVATIAGWDYQGNWVQITLTQGSPTALIQRGTTQGGSDLAFGNVDIATFSDGLTGPPGTVVPVFQHNRIYLPFRFLFNAFGYNADYDLERVGNNAVVIAR